MKWLRIHFLVVSCGSVRCFACFPHSTSSHPRFVSPVEPGRRRPTRPREDGRIRGTSVKSEEEARTPVDSPFTVITSLAVPYSDSGCTGRILRESYSYNRVSHPPLLSRVAPVRKQGAVKG